MALEKCSKCGRMHYRTDPCLARSSEGSSAVERRPSKPTVEGSTPSPRSKKSTAARKDGIANGSSEAHAAGRSPSPTRSVRPRSGQGSGKMRQVGTQAPPVDIPKRGRPRIYPDAAAKQREYRARKKEKTDAEN